MATLFNLGGCSAAKMNGIASLDRVVWSVWRKTQQQLHHPLDHVRVECGHLQPTAVTSAHDTSQVFVNLIEAGGYRIGGKQAACIGIRQEAHMHVWLDDGVARMMTHTCEVMAEIDRILGKNQDWQI